jgi:cyanocobalamin reductase (cyanide-eliminating) / alkylcobalamin dealkylase
MIDALAAAGFDIVQPFDGAMMDPARRAGLLVGNTRALWPRFLAERTPGPDPLDRFVEAQIDPLVPAGARVFYGHRQYDGAFPPLQRIAVASGLGALSEMHLVIHPVYGPWFALRAAIVMPGEPPPATPAVAACACNETCRAALAHAKRSADWRAWLAVRDACTVGRTYRYTDDEIDYHYLQGLLWILVG